MTQNQDPLLQIFKPYFLELITAATESLKHPGEPLNELIEEQLHLLRAEDYNTLYELTEIQKIKLISEITTWLLEEERPPITNDQQLITKPN